MKNEGGKVKAILIAIISILVIAFFAVLIVFKIRGNDDKKNGKAAAAPNADTMTYIKETDTEYTFIDSNGNVRTLKKNSVGTIAFNMNEGNVLHNNSMYAKKDDSYQIIDFNGNKLYEADSISLLNYSEDAVLYQVRKDGKNGVVNAKGEEIIKPEHSESFDAFSASHIDGYVAIEEYDSELDRDALLIFNKDGQRVYKGPIDESSFSATMAKGGTTNSGVSLIVARKDKTNIGVINLKTGEEFNTITDNGDQIIDIDIKGNYALISSYAKGSSDTAIKTYYWFGEDGKVTKKLNLTDKEYISYWNGSQSEEYTIYKNYTNNEEIAIDKYGKEVYKTTGGSLTQRQHTNGISDKTISYVIDNKQRAYKTIKSDGTVLFEDKAVSVVGNKYVAVGTSLYKHDGSLYMENVKGYMSVYDLDIIKTADKIIIENQEGKTIEKEATYNLGKEAELLTDNYVAIKDNKKVKIINMKDLSIKELDFDSANSIYLKKGYICVVEKDSTREYYNANGDKIYTSKK